MTAYADLSVKPPTDWMCAVCEICLSPITLIHSAVTNWYNTETSGSIPGGPIDNETASRQISWQIILIMIILIIHVVRIGD
jgi:hypothetical protein